MKRQKLNPYLIAALALVLLFHLVLLFFTFKRTYDAYVHIFFADHYARAWFDHWEPRWYTGFTMTSYPPASHQLTALLSFAVGLQNGFILVQTFALGNLVVGMYRFSRFLVGEKAAGYAAVITVLASSIVETVHVFGQLPTTLSLGFLLNGLAFLPRWLRTGDVRILLAAWALAAATTAAHHVTTIFGVVFFAFPVIGVVMLDFFRQPRDDEPGGEVGIVTWTTLRPLVMRRLRRMWPVLTRAAIYGFGLLPILLIVVFPYWAWSGSDPITQVPIPHASRDSFIQNTAAGLVFWVIPYGVSLVALPYVVFSMLKGHRWPFAATFGMLFLLGTGGTTPIPKMLLGGAFDILTLDRFTFWATIQMIPFLGEFVISLTEGGLARWLREQFGAFTWRAVQAGLGVAFIGAAVFTPNLTQFRRFQPEPINMGPIVTFLEKDEHWRWRYLTLGFGDQVAWLGAQTQATSVDGNYHSARRLPELTTTPVERLEGAKFRGVQGLGSLQQFVTMPEKYNLKYIFSNDEFYDPLLYFSGWQRIGELENGIVVWEREGVPPLPDVLPRREIPTFQRVMWGTIPLAAIAAALLALTAAWWQHSVGAALRWLGVARVARRLTLPVWRHVEGFSAWMDGLLRRWSYFEADPTRQKARWQLQLEGLRDRLPAMAPPPPNGQVVRSVVAGVLLGVVIVGGVGLLRARATSPQGVILAYYDDLDFRRFDEAYAHLDPNTRPTFAEWQLVRSVQAGIVTNYGKLEQIEIEVTERYGGRATVRAELVWLTSLGRYPQTVEHEIVRRGGQWHISPVMPVIPLPDDQFVRTVEVNYLNQGRRDVTTSTTAYGDILDRPEVTVLSSRVVEQGGRISIVGEVLNRDVNPADLTVTATLYDAEGEALSRYNAQDVVMHKLLPGERTPFRVDFEGVAGLRLEEALEFDPEAFTAPDISKPIAAYLVRVGAVVAQQDLHREVTLQNMQVQQHGGEWIVRGELFNTGLREATIPHLLLTYYDEAGRVLWVDHAYVEDAVRPRRTAPFTVTLTPPHTINEVAAEGSVTPRGTAPAPEDTIGLPWGSLRVSVEYWAAGHD